MLKRLFRIAVALLLIPSPIRADVQLGIDVLKAMDFAPLRGKRVGLITN